MHLPYFIHPPCLKLKKKTLKKTNENFPPLSPNEPNIEKTLNDSPKTTNSPIDISEEVLKSFDDIPKDETLHSKIKTQRNLQTSKTPTHPHIFLPPLPSSLNQERRKFPHKKERTNRNST